MFSKAILAFYGVVFVLAMPNSAAAWDESAAFVEVGDRTSVPIGHYEFCKSYPEECGPNQTLVDTVALTPDKWKQLVGVNAAVNAAVAPTTDQDQYAVEELWTYPQGAGDCEDYALEKRRELVQAGWAGSTLLITVVRQASGAGHAVLLARTDRGDLVLDNQDPDIHVWNETPYTYLKRQSQSNSGEWVTVLDTRAVRVALAH